MTCVNRASCTGAQEDDFTQTVHLAGAGAFSPEDGKLLRDLLGAATSGVFARPECIFRYCPHPEKCDERCANPARDKPGET
jgi:hypothetical protein